MKSAFYVGKERMEVRTGQSIDPGENEVRLAVAWCGICGTDLHIFHGEMDRRVHTPQVIGHEMSGTILDVGRNVKDWRPGDRVAVRPLDWCGECPACRAGYNNICMNLKFMGIDSIGAFQEHWTVHSRTLHRVPDNLDLKPAALIEPLAVACHDVRTSELTAGEFAVVLGGGPIGLLIALVAQSKGIRIVVSEVNPTRLAFAQSLGLTAVNPNECDLVALVQEMSNGIGADAVFEVTAHPGGAQMMSKLLRYHGHIIIVGIFARPTEVDLHRFFWQELRLSGARLYSAGDFDEALALAANQNMPLERMITDTFELDQIQTAFECLCNSPTSVKTLVHCSI